VHLCASLALAWLAIAAPAHAADTAAPGAAIVGPPSNTVARDIIDVDLAALDDTDGLGLRWLELRIGGVFGRTEWPSDRGRFSWNTRYVQDGEYDLMARAVDAAGNTGDSGGTRVRVDNHGVQFATLTAGAELRLPARGAPGDAASPWVAMVRPLDGVVGGTSVALEAFAVDDANGSGVASVEFLVDSTSIGAGTAAGSGYTLNWNSTTVANGSHTITAQAADRNGNTSVSAPVTVTVDNAPPTLVRLTTYDVMVSPPNLDQGTVRVWVQFNPSGSAMDPRSPPTVEVTLPGGGARAVTQVLYLPERGLWIGDVAVDRTADGAGTAMIEVRDARDLGGNAMATVPRAGYIRLVDADPRPPVAGAPMINNMGVPYQYGAGPTYRVHEGVDYRGAAGLVAGVAVATPVGAVRAGDVQAAHGFAPNLTVPVRVEVGTDAAGSPIYQYDVYLHLDNPAAPGAVGVGGRVGDIGNVLAFGPIFHHVHLEFGDGLDGSGEAQPNRNPLFLYEADVDRDPGGNEPALVEGGTDGQTIYLLRRHPVTGALTPFAPPDRVFGQTVIIGEFADNVGYPAFTYPFSIGYRIRPTRALGRAVRTSETPYLLSRWFDYDIAVDSLPDFERYVSHTYSTRWPSPVAGTPFLWTRHHHALVTNAGGTSGAGADRAVDQFWYTRARSTATRDNGSDDAVGAASMPSARFRDGRYRIELFGADLTVRPDPAAPGGRRLYTMVGDQEAVVDNYPPYLEELVVTQDTGRARVRYRGRWEPGAAAGTVALQPTAMTDRNRHWINGQDDVQIIAIFSEPLDAAPTPPTLSIKRTDGSQRDEALAVGPLTANRVWTLTIPQVDTDLAGHRLDSVAGGDLVREVAFSGQDLAGNDLDTNPVTAAFRNEATGLHGATYEHAAVAAWGGRVVDLHHDLRIDTKHNEKPQLPTRLEPG